MEEREDDGWSGCRGHHCSLHHRLPLLWRPRLAKMCLKMRGTETTETRCTSLLSLLEKSCNVPIISASSVTYIAFSRDMIRVKIFTKQKFSLFSFAIYSIHNTAKLALIMKKLVQSIIWRKLYEKPT